MSKIERVKTTGKYLSLFLLVVVVFTISAFAQDLPSEIRGYKVHKAKISVVNQNEKTGNSKSGKNDESEAFVNVSAPELAQVSLTGITLELSAEIEALEQSGKVDFLTFHDFRVNGLAVDVEEYRESFEFKKNQKIALPKPIVIFVGTGQTLRGALAEFNESKTEWTVTGRIFVFGHFKKAGFSFKRVVPVEINLKIENPLQYKK
jgi:hypothetical protein